jgi:hypothetical protein
MLLFPFQLDFFGNFVSSLLATSGVHIAWWVFSAALIIVSTTLGVLGVKPSLRTGLIGLGFEMLILTIFALVIIVKGGASGNTIHAFNPSHSLKGSGGCSPPWSTRSSPFVGESATTLGDERASHGGRFRRPSCSDPGRRRLLRARVVLGDHRLRGVRQERPVPRHRGHPVQHAG